VPGVDLGRFGLLMALAGGLTTLAPLLFAALNAMFPSRHVPVMAPKGEVFGFSAHSILVLAGQPRDRDKEGSKRRSFMI
jgi:hypothetical protein